MTYAEREMTEQALLLEDAGLPRPQFDEVARTKIVGVGSAAPKYCYSQGAITSALKQLWADELDNPALLDRIHARTRVASRHLAFPLQRYPQFASWGETNSAWLEVAEELGSAAIDSALHNAGMARHELDALFVVSITGIASPSLDARLINRLGLRSDIKRTPIFGVGCVGGALGLTRAADYTLAYPAHTAAILAVEVCSLAFRQDDLSKANLVSTGLFADGAAAVIVAGSEAPAAHIRDARPCPFAHLAPKILGSGSIFYPDSEDIMGWDISEKGFRIVLSPRLPDFIRAHLAADVDMFLGRYDLCRADIGNWVIHTGGPKVLEAIQGTLDLDEGALDRSWDCLRRFGNLSSASVLLVLEDVVAHCPPAPGTLGVLLAMGPGFCSEMILLRW
jgi:alkylresorcinol/alkylpyrone synthase